MHDKRIKIFVIFSALFLLAFLLRLIQMQLLPDSSLQDDIAELKRQRSLSRQFMTARGKILDRSGKILAADEPQFQLCINYQLTRFLDQRVRNAMLLKDAGENNANPSLSDDLRKEMHAKLEDLRQIIEKCSFFGFKRSDIELKITQLNSQIWNLREYLAWKRNFSDSNFAEAVPDANERLLLTAAIDIAEMHKSWPLLELKTDDDIFAAQLEFIDVDDVEILPMAKRVYPFGSVATQTIGWVGPATLEKDRKLFENDNLASYLDDEVCGREDGVEYVCESILRGRRGEEVYDIDRQLVSRTETQLGRDVSLTLDIELQKQIEDYLLNYKHEQGCGPGMAVVVIDVATGDILALVSMPVFDLNNARYDYGNLVNDPAQPLINRAINKQYPPGSVIKPLILIAGLESGKITAEEIISCPAQKAPTGWPSCWLYNKYNWTGHDDMWQNNARNAVKGSCNIYFSRLADRLEPIVLQQWLFKFGYGHQIPLLCPRSLDPNENRDLSTGSLADLSAGGGIEHRDFRQTQGVISSISPKGEISRFEDVPSLEESEKRFFGIGQGNLRVTPLQVANAMAAIARGGVYKPPRLFITPVIASEVLSLPKDEAKQSQTQNSKFKIRNSDEIDLGISEQTLNVIYDGMDAVVNDPGGTAYREFAYSGLTEYGVKVYGKTGSTEAPDNAWFAGFAKDNADRKLAIAVVVEGGQHGSADAAPLARDILQFCINAGYIGKSQMTTE